MRTISAHKIAKELNVSHVSVYRWIKSGKLKARIFTDGPRTQYEVLTEDFEHFRDLMRGKSEARNAALLDPPPPNHEWFEEYRAIFGCYPAEYVGFKKGTITIQQAQTELAKRINQAEKLLHYYKAESEK